MMAVQTQASISIEEISVDQSHHLGLDFSLKQLIIEEHKPSQIYAIRFCEILPAYWSYFATVGGNCASVYEVGATRSVDFIQAYVDSDLEEVIYACCWGSTQSGTPLLVLAGLRGILKAINCLTFELEVTLLGHGDAVNDLRIHPVDDGIVFSASKDESVRMWNLKTAVCIAIFAGEKGHRDEVLSVDPHPLGNCILSTGMDISIKVWNLQDPSIVHAIEQSYIHPRRPGNLAFRTYTQQVPLFSTNQVHSDYVDSARWYGDCILSKSTKNRIALWSPDSNRYKGAPLILREYCITDCDLWFVRLDICVPLDLLAVGNKFGKVSLFSLSGDTLEDPEQTSKGPHCNYHTQTTTCPTMSCFCSLFILIFTDMLQNGVDHHKGGSNGSSVGQHSKTFPGATVAVKERIETPTPYLADAVLAHPKCQSTVRQIAFSPDGTYLVYCCDNGSVWLWSIDASKP